MGHWNWRCRCRYDREAHVWIKLTIAVFERYRGTELAFARKLEAG